MKATMKQIVARIFVMAIVVCLMVSCVLPQDAFAANDAVNNARSGVLQVNLEYRDDDGNMVYRSGGSGFLINDNTLITCHHVIQPSDEDVAWLAENQARSTAEIRDRMQITVTVSRDVTIPATVVHQSFEMDWAILRLSTSMKGRTPLSLRSSSTVKTTENVYAIGFPAISTILQTYSTFTSEDATITAGVVNKVDIGVNMHSDENTEFIMTSCNLDSGCSGGPMIDESGHVVGVAQGVWQMSDGGLHPEFYNAIAIDQVVVVLDAMGITYDMVDGDVPAPEPATEAATEPATEAAPEPATEAAPEPATEAAPEPVTIPTPEPDVKSGLSTTTIILLVAGVAVVAVVVVVIVVLSKNKKPAPVAAGSGTYVPPAPAPRPAAPAGFTPVAPAPVTAPAGDAGETTVLGQSAGETTVLSRNVNGGTLIRKRTGESISINAENFVIGREPKNVNYCIADNTSISRSHVKLTVRNGVTYLADLGAANGTFVNGVKAMPRQEIALKNGDKITLADEDLEYKN